MLAVLLAFVFAIAMSIIIKVNLTVLNLSPGSLPHQHFSRCILHRMPTFTSPGTHRN
jgi:hypothetical protein